MRRNTFTKRDDSDKPVPGSRYNRSPKISAGALDVLRRFAAGESIQVDAQAGSGKTTLACALCALTAVAPCEVLYVVRNRANAREAIERMPDGVTVKTADALGYAMAGCKGASSKTKTNDVLIALGIMSPGDLGDNCEDTDEPNARMIEAVDLARHDLARTPAECRASMELRGYGDLDEADVSRAVLECDRLAYLRKETGGVYDYTDGPRGAAFHGTPQGFRFVIFDEGQDASRAMLGMLKRATKGSALLAIGDPYQGIYGFAGAGDDVWTDLGERCPGRGALPVSWRVSRAVAEYAALLDGGRTTARPDAPEGAVEFGGDPFAAGTGDMVLCRVNAPAIEYAVALWCRSLPFVWGGRDEKSPFVALAGKVYRLSGGKGGTPERFAETLDSLAESDQGENPADATVSIALFARALRAKGATSNAQMYAACKGMGEGSDGPRVATIHRSKGLEGRDVYVLPAPDRGAPDTEFAVLQERNAEYVARTRAMGRLVYC